ncbi:MAG: HAD family hydrolase [Paracoccaceae bacterium]
MRIAMWSGPRNLSTAMMYSFASRGDCAVWDEPFYAAYLAITGLQHPLTAEILEAHENDPAEVAAMCAGPIPDGQPHFYLKLMTHHMLDDIPLDWAADYTHVHLIRHPARVISSYSAKRENPTLEDLGYPQQVALYRQLGGVVVDSDDIRADPAGTLGRLCTAIGLPFTDQMLHWPAGPRAEDGVWAQHWYNAVHQSTGFAVADGPLPEVDPEQADLLAAAEPLFQELWQKRL